MVVALALISGGMWAWVTWGPADLVEAAFLAPNAIVVVERRLDGESSLGGVRLVLLEPGTGKVLTRVRADDRALLAVVNGVAWFRSPGLLEARDPATLQVTHSQEELVQRWPELKALEDDERGCVEPSSGVVRFTSTAGDQLAFDLGALKLEPTSKTSCESSGRLETRSELQETPHTYKLRRGDTSARVEVVDEQGMSMGSGGLGVHFLVHELPLDGDLLLLRRATTAPDAPTELVRLSVTERKERWSTVVRDERFSPEQLLLVQGCLVLGDGRRVLGLDATTGRVLWRRD
jgi:hypothetical protein